MKKLKKTYRYALKSALYLSVLSITVASFFYFFIFNHLGFISVFFFGLVLFIISFFLIQFRAENFIYQQIKKLYNDISFLDIDDINRKKITTDVYELTKSVKAYVKDKRDTIANLTEKDSFRRDFLGNVAHELKTPLFTVQGYILTLIEGASDDVFIRDKYLKRANKGVERLISIIKDLDMIAKMEIEGMKMNLQSFNILDTIQNVFDLLEMNAKKRNITLRFDKVYEFPVYVTADIERIEQVLINLIVNSIKYGKKNGITTVSIDNTNENKFTVKISDNGVGIKQEHLQRLFERFYRADKSRSREQGGSGLGLSIVKHIIEAHNETIYVNSRIGYGSEFFFTIQKSK